jgi:hypothetical protein
LENLDEMENFLDRYQIPKLNKDQKKHLESPITPKVIEAVIKFSQPKKTQDQMGLVQNSIRPSIPILFKLLHKTETEWTLPNSFYEATIMLIAKPHKDPTKKKKKENFRPISLKNIYAKIINKILTNQIQEHIKMIIHLYLVGFIEG